MKVYAPPADVTFSEVDYLNYDREREIAREAENNEMVRAWLKEQGFIGKHSGKIMSLPFADGHAQYMLADGKPGTASFLVHLPHGDAYHNPLASGLTKKAVIDEIIRGEKLAEIFAKPKDDPDADAGMEP